MRTILYAVFASVIAASRAHAASERLTVLISDTHFGVGHAASGKWDNLEDARWAPEFTAFLKEIDKQGKGAADLVINGDAFELWQSLAMDCIYPDAAHQDRDLGCTEQDALRRVNRVLGQHSPELKALGDFASSGNNRLILLPGNHDAALLFPEVGKAVLAAIAATANRVQLLQKGYWLSSDKLIYAEHGHQIGEELNRFDAWPTPFLNRDGRVYLQRPWGEQMVQQFYNDYEKKYPVIDNFTEDSIGMGYGLAAEGRAASFDGGAKFFRMALFQVSMKQFARTLGKNEGKTKWDVDAARAKGGEFLIESIPKDDPMRAVAEATLGGATLGDMTDDEIHDICDRRAEMMADGKQIDVCAAASQGAAAQRSFLAPKAVITKHLNDTYKRLRDGGETSLPFQVFIYSHTHFANGGFQPFDGSGTAWNPWVINTGAWQRIVSKEQFEKILAAKGIATNEALQKLQPEDLPSCYDTVVIPPYQTDPNFQLKGWRTNPDETGTLGSPCR